MKPLTLLLLLWPALALAQAVPAEPGLRFDSRDVRFKAPFGAQPAGSSVSFSVEADSAVTAVTLVIERRLLEGDQELRPYTPVARVPMKPEAGQWTARYRFDTLAVYGYWFEAEAGGRRYALQNNADEIPWTREKGAGGAGTVAALPASASELRRFRQTIYDPAFKTPDWAADAVYYYVFPERFRNGDRGNDPKPGRDRYMDQGVELHKDWNERPSKPGTGDGSDAVYNNDFFGGDLAGIIDKLDEIRDLGADTLYLTPIFRAPSNHKYDTADYRNVDPAFGTNADFERLTREAARRGMRVLPDSSFNHTGSDSLYFNRYGNFGSQGAFQGGKIAPASPYASWYRFDTAQGDPDKQYRGWLGIATLPELDKGSASLREFLIRAPDSITKLWLDRGAAGWRMDVAPWVPDDFWREWRGTVKAHRPDALTVAETWFDASKHLLGDMFDSTMNYIFRNAVLDWAAGGRADTMLRSLEHVREAYPPPAFGVLMNLLSTHDQPRALHHFGWTPEKQDEATVARAKARLKLAVLFQMSYPGSPAVYYGDEVGVTGGEDPYNRATYPWADLGGKPDLALRAEFKRLIALRRANPVLRRGSVEPLMADEHAVVIARRLGSQWAITAMNNAEQPRRVTVKLPAGAPPSGWRDALGERGATAEGGSLVLELPPLFGRVLLAP